MELHNLTPAAGSTKNSKRVGRGEGSGKGGTSTRGHKGAKSRSGYKRKRNFEGGQMPLQMRLPKLGFKNFNRTTYVVLNLDTIQNISEKYSISEITMENLYENNIIKKGDKVKVLGSGELNSKIDVKVNAASKSAKEAIEAKGGSVTIL